MLLALLTAAALSTPPHYDAFLGLSPEQAQQAKDYAADYGMTPEIEATTKIGADTLVMWWRPLKGNEGFGLQVYGADGKFKTRLEDSEFPSAKATLCGRYIVGERWTAERA